MSEWNLKNKNDSGYSSDEEKIANNFNEHFNKKISDQKKNADQEMVEDPLARLRKRMSTKSCKFNLKKLSKEKVQEGFTKMKKKKSSGSDGLTQEQLAEGVNELAAPLRCIFNGSYKSASIAAKSCIHR